MSSSSPEPGTGRPADPAVHGTRYDTGQAVAVALDGGRVAAWVDGQFTGDPVIVRDAKAAAEFGWVVPVVRVPLVASADTPVGAVAALCAHDPGRTIVAECPREIRDVLAAWHAEHTARVVAMGTP